MLPEFVRASAGDGHKNVVTVKIFKLPEGWASVVSWPPPDPGLRTFSPTATEPDSVRHALPYAQFLREHLGALHVAVELDDGVEWNPAWGRLTG